MPESTLIADDLFRVDADRMVLLATRRRSSGAIEFPRQIPDIHGPADDMELVELSGPGTLFTFTTQEFAPPAPYRGIRSPGGFAPYVVGFVELADSVLVEGLIVGADADDLHIGQPMTLTSTTITTAEGNGLLTFAFAPV